MPTKEQKGLRETRKGLDQSARADQLPVNMPRRYQQLSAVDLYSYLLRDTRDLKGVMSFGFGQAGWGVGVDAGVDFGDFFVPGLVSASVGAELEGSISQAAAVIIHRSMPRIPPPPTIPGGSTVSWPSPATSGATSKGASAMPPSPAETTTPYTNRPVCLMSMTGKAASFEAGVGASLGIGKEIEIVTGSEVPDMVLGTAVSITEITLGLGISAAVGASYQYDRMFLRDAAPGWYGQLTDQGLISDFYKSINPSPEKTKAELLAWISDFNKKVYPLSRLALVAGNVNPELLQQDFLSVNGAMLEKRDQKKQSTVGAFFSTLATKTKDLAKSPKISLIYGKLGEKYNALQSAKLTTEELLTTINDLLSIIPDDTVIEGYFILIPSPQRQGDLVWYLGDPKNMEMMKTAMKHMRYQLEMFRWKLSNSMAAGSSTKRGNAGEQRYNTGNCFLKIVSHSPGVEGNVSATAVALNATANVRGSYKRSRYRYQTYTPIRNTTLYYTQDTIITYRQAKLESGAGVLNLYNQSIEKEIFRRGMTYQSGNVYWDYSKALRSSPGSSIWFHCLPGSGLSYGVSVEVADLKQCIVEIGGPLPRQQNLLDRFKTWRSRGLLLKLANNLRVSIHWLVPFLQSIPQTVIDRVAVRAILLESSFVLAMDSLTRESRINANSDPKTNAYVLASILDSPLQQNQAAQLNNMTNAYANCQNYLQALRLRTRMADYDESKASFKLGVPVPITNLNIELSHISSSGNEGIIDLYTWYCKDTNEDGIVPPVALFHQ